MHGPFLCFPAYIDPGSGSYVLQIIAATFFAVVFTLKVFWSRVRAFFTKRRNTGSEDS
jgi:hypothetical protein